MTTVYFVRHAQPNYTNHDDLTRELTAKGMDDRALVVAYLLDKDVDAVLSSPFLRAMQTVEPLAQALGLSMEIVQGFRERRVDSIWIEDFTAFTKQQWEDFDYKLSDGECLREVQRRNIAALHEVLGRYADKTVVIGSHGTALSTVINHYDPTFGYEAFERIRWLMPWIVRLDFEGDTCKRISYIDVLRG